MEIDLSISQSSQSIRKPLTRKQKEIFYEIFHYISKKGYPPTRLEIAEAISKLWNKKVSRQAIDFHLNLIAKKGWLKIKKGQPRNIIVNFNELDVSI